MKKILLVTILCTGCATYPDSYFVYSNQKYNARQAVNSGLSQGQTDLVELGTAAAVFVGPNQFTQNMNSAASYTRNANAMIQNPWLAFYTLRNNTWLK